MYIDANAMYNLRAIYKLCNLKLKLYMTRKDYEQIILTPLENFPGITEGGVRVNITMPSFSLLPNNKHTSLS